MIEDDLDLILDNEGKKPYEGTRPVFLQVLCILTFVGAGLGILSGFIGILMMGTMEVMVEGMATVAQDMPGDVENEFLDSYRWMKIAQVGSLVGNVLCLVGALVMWRMNKIGYFVYILGQALPIAGAFLTMNNIAGGIFSGFGFAGVVLMSLIPIAFIIMYGLNYKYMK
jgi:hypothetical protein